jgi:hypothetical protein
LKGSFLAVGIVGILLILAGIVFALQGSGMIGGSAMSGNSFWTYAGSGLAIFGVIIASLGFYMGSKSRTSKTMTRNEKARTTADVGLPTSDSSTQDKDKQTNTI